MCELYYHRQRPLQKESLHFVPISTLPNESQPVPCSLSRCFRKLISPRQNSKKTKGKKKQCPVHVDPRRLRALHYYLVLYQGRQVPDIRLPFLLSNTLHPLTVLLCVIFRTHMQIPMTNTSQTQPNTSVILTSGQSSDNITIILTTPRT